MFKIKVTDKLAEYEQAAAKALKQAIRDGQKAAINRAIIESPPFAFDEKGGAYDDAKSASKKIKSGVIRRQKAKIINQIMGKGYTETVPSTPANPYGNPIMRETEQGTRPLGLVLLRKPQTKAEKKNAKKATVIRTAGEAIEYIRKNTEFSKNAARVVKKGYKSRFISKGALEKAANHFAKRAGNFVSGWMAIQKKLKNEKQLASALKNQQVDYKGSGQVISQGNKSTMRASAEYGKLTPNMCNYLRTISKKVTKNAAKFISNQIAHINFKKIAKTIKNK